MTGGPRTISKSKIQIKPFAQAPKPPSNLLQSLVTDLLLPSLDSILCRDNRSGASREELHRAVQDLCTHGHGVGLYRVLIQALNHAAESMIRRRPPEMALADVHALWDEYTDYLACVRNIFQPLDCLLVYLPATGHIVPRTQTTRAFSSSSVAAAAAAAAGECGHQDHAWGLWEAGLFALYRPLTSQQLSQQDYRAGSLLAAIQDSILAAMTRQLDTATFTLPNNPTTADPHSDSSYVSAAIRDSIFFLQQLSTVSTGQSVFWITSAVGSTQSLTLPPPDERSLSCSMTIHTQPVMQIFAQDMTLRFMQYLHNECQSLMKIMEAPHDHHQQETTTRIRQLLTHIDTRLKQVHGMTHMYFYYPGPDKQKQKLISHHHDTTCWNIHQKGLLSRIVEKLLLTPLFTTHYIFHPLHFFPLMDAPLSSIIIPQHNNYYTTTTTDSHRQEPLFYIQKIYAFSKRIAFDENTTNHPLGSIGHILQSIFTPTTSSFWDNIKSILESSSYNTMDYHIKGIDRVKQALMDYGQNRGLACLRTNSTTTSSSSSASLVGSSGIGIGKDVLCKSIIPSLFNFKRHLENISCLAFSKDDILVKCVKNILEFVLNSQVHTNEEKEEQKEEEEKEKEKEEKTLVNSRHHLAASAEGDGGKSVAELLAKFVDLRFKDVKGTLVLSTGSSGLESYHSDDLETFQEAVLDLFRHIHSKDIFEAFYRRDLAKRLMLNKSTSIDAERSFVSKLKAECGAGYTSKMEGMFQDIDLSKDVMNMYQSYSVGDRALIDLGNTTMDMEVQVLTTGYWPVYPQSASIILPNLLEKQKEHFETYYNNKYQGRRLAWQYSLGSCIVRAVFPKVGVRELVVSLPQALVLLCFNDETTVSDSSPKPCALTISEIMTRTGLDDRSDTERVLQSLSLGRDGTRVLTKIDVDSNDKAALDGKHKKVRRSVSDHDLFTFNAAFTSNQHRIKITNIQVKETSEEREKTHEAVSQDRLYLIDAAIVRIMKARKTMDHRTLVGEVMTQIKFPANGSDIKKRIESLIEREYLERTERDHAIYNYLA